MDYLKRHQRGKCSGFRFSSPWSGNAPLVLSETYPFKKEIVVDVVLSCECCNAAVFHKSFKRHANQPELKFGRGRILSQSSGVHLIKISGRLIYRERRF